MNKQQQRSKTPARPRDRAVSIQKRLRGRSRSLSVGRGRSSLKEHAGEVPRSVADHRRVEAARREVRAVTQHPLYRVLRLITDGATDRKVAAVKDEKGDDATILMLQKVLNGARGVVRGLNLHNYSSWLTVVGNMVGSTATAYNTVVNVEPDNTGEFSTFASLFDECKVEEVKMQWRVMRSAGASGDTLISLAGFAYDPIDNGAYSSLAVLCEASQHTTFALEQIGVGNTQVPAATQPHGLMHWRFRMPPGPGLESSGTADSNVVTGLWSSTAQSNQRYGFIKPYLEAGPTGVSWTIRYILWLRVSFRSRT